MLAGKRGMAKWEMCRDWKIEGLSCSSVTQKDQRNIKSENIFTSRCIKSLKGKIIMKKEKMMQWWNEFIENYKKKKRREDYNT